MVLRFVIVLTFFFLVLPGCRTTSTLNFGNRTISSTEVQEIARAHHARIQSLQGEGRITIESSETVPLSGSFVLTLLKPDSLLINVRGPFGIKVGSALITRSGFSFYYSLENKLITGPASIENLNRILHVQLSFDDLLNIFAGGEFLQDDLRSPDETRIENNQFVFTYTSQTSSRRYWIDPTSLNIQKVQFLDLSGMLTLEQTFNDFENVQGIDLPFAIRITQPNARHKLSVQYSDIMVNAEQLQFTFSIPQNAERIRW